MSEKISHTELDKLIRNKIREKGLSNDIGEDKISEITHIISSQLKKPELTEVAPAEKPIAQASPIQNTVPQTPIDNTPNAITQTTTVSKDAVDLAKREGELEEKEKSLAQKQSELTIKEKDLLEKEQALAYKPQIPEVLEGLGNEKLFVFNEDELSLGAEALSSALFRLMSNPDDKRSMIELWATEGKKGADVYTVKFEKSGEIIFNPFEGTATYTKKPFEDGETPLNISDNSGLTPKEAYESQEPAETMIDIVEPKTDVTLPTSNDMGLHNNELDSIIKNRIDAIIQSHFIEKYPKM